MDRNPGTNIILSITVMSLSARRAWIEIFRTLVLGGWGRGVALRKESVDRNPDTRQHDAGCLSRSPQGERG